MVRGLIGCCGVRCVSQCPCMYESPPGRVQSKKKSAQVLKTVVSSHSLELIVVFLLLAVTFLFS